MSFPLAAYGINPDDIRYFHIDSVVRGKGPDRLKYLDMEGRWVLSGRSIPFISAAFNHLDKLNYAKGTIFDTTQPALDAIGMMGWNQEKQPKKKPFVLPPQPVVEVVKEPESPREIVPHRSAGYGPAHQKRKLSIPDRSRSPSITSRTVSPTPEFDRYATKYNRKDSMTYYGTKWNGSRDDQGYSSGAPSPNTSAQDQFERMPHRTQAISPLPDHHSRYDSQYDSSFLKRASESGQYLTDTAEIRDRANRARYNPKTYYFSSRSHTDYSTGSEQPSPDKRQTAEEYLLDSYHEMVSRGNFHRQNVRN